ncbi:MAG: PQQ-binding-like beta-propeller repeat protein, partial [Verrucomicrobiota bacterium]
MRAVSVLALNASVLLASAFIAPVSTARADWLMHRGGPALAGVSSMRAAECPKEQWSFAAGKPIKGGAAIVGGTLFVGDDAGVLHALSMVTVDLLKKLE